MERLFAKRWFPIAAIAVATLLVWGHTVGFKFVWDDFYFIVDLKSVHSLKSIPEMFYKLDAQATMPEFRVFRPLRTAQYALLHFFTGQAEPQPWIFHLANVLWHGATGVILYFTARRLLSLLWPTFTGTVEPSAFFVALAFVVHPVVSEVVCWAKSLDDIMAAAFTLAALNELLKSESARKHYFRALIYFILAVYSKESAVPFALITPILLWGFHKRSIRETASVTVAFFTVAAVYMTHRHLVIGRSSQIDPISGSYGQTLIDMLPVVPKYLRLLCGIPPFFIDYSFMEGGFSWTSIPVVGGAVMLAALIGCAFLAVRAEAFRPAAFGLFWLGAFLLPVSNILPMMQYMAERFLYLPLIGWLLAIVPFLLRLPSVRFVRAVTVCLAIAWGIVAWNRSWIWEDPVTLFVRTSQEAPPMPRVQQNAVAAIFELPHLRKVFHFEQAGPNSKKLKSIDPITPSEFPAVLQTLHQAAKLFPTNELISVALGISYAMGNAPQKAIPYLEQSVKLAPNNGDYWNNLAKVSIETKNYKRAHDAVERANQLSPNNPTTLRIKARLAWDEGDYKAAKENYKALNALEPSAENEHWMQEAEKKIKGSSNGDP